MATQEKDFIIYYFMKDNMLIRKSLEVKGKSLEDIAKRFEKKLEKKGAIMKEISLVLES